MCMINDSFRSRRLFVIRLKKSRVIAAVARFFWHPPREWKRCLIKLGEMKAKTHVTS